MTSISYHFWLQKPEIAVSTGLLGSLVGSGVLAKDARHHVAAIACTIILFAAKMNALYDRLWERNAGSRVRDRSNEELVERIANCS
jgi:hypothetical protein